MSTTDWNTVTSDLQRAANNLAWFVLESMTIPGQPPPFVSLQNVAAPPIDLLLQDNQSDEQPVIKKKKMDKPTKRTSKIPIGKAVDRLVSETLV